jgi:hypothetical protein
VFELYSKGGTNETSRFGHEKGIGNFWVYGWLKIKERIMKSVFSSLIMLFLVVGFCACGSKKSSVEGKLVDWNGKPVAKVKITASQVQPIKGYEQFEAVTNSEGAFGIKGLFPSSQYVLKPWSDKWTCESAVQIDSAPQGETAVLPSAMVINKAYSKTGGSLVYDLDTGALRFAVSPEGVITDSQTGLDWLVGPDRDIKNYDQAHQWVAGCSVAGGNWRMPTCRELASLYQGEGERNMDPAFKTTGWYVWAESSGFNFNGGSEGWTYRNGSYGTRVFAVRSRPR